MATTPPQSRPRRTQSRPGMVPLSEFGKAPPPPPRAKASPRTVAISLSVVVLILAIAGAAIYAGNQAYQSAWGSVKCVDARTKC